MTERNFKHATLDWSIPIEQAAIVCVDVWAWHYADECRERINQICHGPIARLVEASRKHGLKIIHAPASPVAEKSSGWVGRAWAENEPKHPTPQSNDWPPASFKNKVGEYASFARPRGPHRDMIDAHRESDRWYHPCCTPVDGEPVIRNGDELHRLCKQSRILHLFYIGFNTNACLVLRDYGIPAMAERGYHTLLLRDATTGMETADTLPDMACTRGAIASFEQFGSYTLTTDELIQSLEQANQVNHSSPELDA